MSSKRASAKLTKEIYSNILKNVGMNNTQTKGKSVHQLERHMKGVANHHRISILFLIAKNEGITLDQITQSLEANFKTISVHTQKLLHAGLISKKYVGKSIAHALTPLGKKFYSFLQSF